MADWLMPLIIDFLGSVHIIVLWLRTLNVFTMLITETRFDSDRMVNEYLFSYQPSSRHDFQNISPTVLSEVDVCTFVGTINQLSNSYTSKISC